MKIDRRQVLLGLGALAATPVFAPAARAQIAPDLWARVSTMAETIIADKLTPGLQISVRKGSDILFEQGFGLANMETGTPLTASSVMRIGSVTKQFTAATILLLEADGKLAITDPLSRFLPNFPRAKDITLERMLNHTSGLGNYTDAASLEAFLQGGRPDRSMAEMVALMAASDNLQKSEPGTAWAYSNTAYVLLGAVIEAADGKPLPASMHDRLFSPLGLTATAMDDAADIVSGRASGYTNTTGPVGFDNASFLSMTYPGAAGAMRSTTTDLCRWHQALLGGRVLSSSSLAKMLTPATLADGTLPKDGDAEVRYGFGLQLSPADTREVISHGGGINGFASYLGTYREADLSLATIVNTDGGFIGGPGAGPRVQAIRGLIRDSLLTV